MLHERFSHISCETVNLLIELGITIHPDKSSLIPAQNIHYHYDNKIDRVLKIKNQISLH